MRIGIARILFLAAAGLWLVGCSADKFSNPFDSKSSGADAYAAAPTNDSSATDPGSAPLGAQATAEPAKPEAPVAADAGLLGGDPNDDLSLGKKQYHANNFGLAEKYFRRAAELHPRDAEAWLGLAASYDRLRRFDLADRAYAAAIRLVGPTAEILNDQGFSYMLRGDYARAHKKLEEARAKDPSNPYVQANMQLLEESYRNGRAIQ